VSPFAASRALADVAGESRINKREDTMTRGLAFCSALPLLVLGACENEDYGVGDPCIPDPIPCQGESCGFQRDETYLQTNSDECKERACIVRRLDNGTGGALPADPRVMCEEDAREGCVSREALSRGAYCTCRCDGPKTAADFCECPDGFLCEPVLQSGDPSEHGSYCVRAPGG
jgi:hypothetical protein